MSFGSGRLASVAVTVLLCTTTAWAAESQPRIAPAPAWVKATPAPAADPTKNDLPMQVLLSSMQQRLGPGISELHFHMVAIPQTTAGLQALGNIVIPWNSERSDLVIHQASLRRADQVIDLLKSQELVILRRENNLENSVLDGVRTVVIQAAGLQVGDVVDLSFTSTERPGTIGAKPETIIPIADPVPYGLLERRFLVDDQVKIKWKASQALGPLRKTRTGDAMELLFTKPNYTPVNLPANAPVRFRNPAIQLSSYATWQEVADVMRPLFDKARQPGPNSPLLAEAEIIAKAHQSPEARMMAALRLSQEKVRYVALVLGEGTHIPATADQSWERKFGDCKGKTALLLALLDRLGIQAGAMLTSAQASELLGERLPSLYAFDHVVVRAHVNGRDYVLDPTGYGTRTLEEVALSPFAWGLPLAPGTQLVNFASTPPEKPLTETEIVWDASQGFDQQVPFTSKLVYRGATASLVRAFQAAAPDRATMEKFWKAAVPRIDNDLLQVTAVEPEGNHGEFTVRFKGRAPMRWVRSKIDAARQFKFDSSTTSWNTDFERKDGLGKELPVALANPFWTRGVETVVLPAKGAGFSLRGQPINSKVAGTEIRRGTTLIEGKATSISDFRRLSGEISATEAREAANILKQIDDSEEYIFAPKDYAVSRNEVKAILSEVASGYDDFVRRARYLMDQYQHSRANAELEKAIKADPNQPEAPALLAINLAYLNRVAEARSILSNAQKLDPDDWDVLRAQALVAWREYDSATALRSISRAIDRDPTYGWQYNLRARIYAGIGQYDQALADANRAAELSGKASDYAMVAQIQAASGKIDAALATLDKAEKSDDPDKGNLALLRGDYLTRLGRTDEAKAVYSAARASVREEMLKAFAEHAPQGTPVPSDLDWQILLSTRSYAEAAPLLDRKIAEQRYPSASNLARRALNRTMTGNYEGAKKDARAALDLDPTSIEAMMAMTLSNLRAGKFAEAEAMATRFLSSDRANPVMLYARSLARKSMGKSAEAASDLEKARQLQFDVMLEPVFLGITTN